MYYNEINGQSNSEYPQANQGTAYFIYSIVYFCINFGVFFILNTSLEIKIVRRMQKELREKRERFAKMNAANSVVNIDSHKSQTDLENNKKEEEDSKKERKVIKMVVINGFFNFILRAPEMVFWIENSRSWPLLFGMTRESQTFSFPGFLNLIADVGYLAYILTFSLNVIIFYKFNNNFGKAVKLFLTTKSKETFQIG
jgi:ABC-type multidrug transport system fused ATPase/permease subunit